MGARKWEYNEDYFEKIDSNEKAYWFGFITADGYVQDNRKTANKSTATSLRIRLSEVDKSHLEKLNSDIQSNKPIKVVKNYGIYENCKDLAEFNLSSCKMVDDLSNLGLVPGNKSCHEVMPTWDDDILIKNFILGIFDGDGSIATYKGWSTRDNKYKDLAEWGIVSSEAMCNSISKFLSENVEGTVFHVSKNSNKKDNELYRVRTGSKVTMKKLYEYFYGDNCSTSIMDRKYDKFAEL